MNNFEFYDRFLDRHIGPSNQDIKEMLKTIKVSSLDELIDQTIPNSIRLKSPLELEPPLTEFELISHLKEIAKKNKVYKTYIGMGYYPTITPSVIKRNILENPGWYTQYTPYQPEISQGRLEALLNFQTMIIDLTAMQIANASLLDEGTAAAEAMSMLYSSRKSNKKNSNVFFVSEDVFPQTIDVLLTRAEPLGIKIQIGNHKNIQLTDEMFGILVQYPAKDGQIYDYRDLFKQADQLNIFKAVAADILSLALLIPPGEFGADVVVGSTQRFGVPMGYGGPHAAYFATKEEFKRQIPGRIIGVSIDSHGRHALRMALQTREQHIKREHATSNICTAQVLLAIMAGMYAVYHGPKGIKAIAERIHKLTVMLDKTLQLLGLNQVNKIYFDTLKIKLHNEDLQKIKEISLSKEINLNYVDETTITLSLDETKTYEDVLELIEIFKSVSKITISEKDIDEIASSVRVNIPEELKRTSKYLTHPVFNSFYSETEMMRYIKSLEQKDLSLTTSMTPLGSCTMKLNAAAELIAISWPEFSDIHPFAPLDQTEGYQILFSKLKDQLTKITGFSAVSLQPNSGAQGEFTGLMVIRAYHRSRGDVNRNVVLIPSSAHGTNPASAVMAGNKVVVVKCDEDGNIDLSDLLQKAEQYKDSLSALMVTYPSTHGVFEENIVEICEIVHRYGGLVYMDGANLNAQVGLTNPKTIGADVCHLNLHKTFAIPHGGGGPGAGPIAAAEYLSQFLPGHSIVKIGSDKSIHAVSSAPWGSASILIISYAYIKMMGADGLTLASKIAILNANYLKAKLENYYNVLYTGKNGFVAHELIFDVRKFKQTTGVDVEDIAKRLMDYGYHAPTVSFPVPGTLMVEPTESESLTELNKFCDALISIRNEIEEIENGVADKVNNVLKNAPHTALEIVSEDWKHPYSREKAAFPSAYTKQNKFWPAVGRVNNAYGDRNLVCSCLPVSVYETEKEYSA
ncbi:aminomethyl-transferring glycine dehydrogenase [Melioribacteraceae bacterium 4301-Me]|uniref:aminomethyl-transferring glycine dehydrogenase n=1 Tax=Pyranulibacter aquaticus TaxID=3163344 RepID=UPI0035984C27